MPAHTTRLPNLAFEQASCTQLPSGDGAFDLVVAFEVIEHLENWRDFLAGSRGACWRPAGQLIVSTPNRLYYTESRGAAGANPFHVHEFEFEEFAPRAEVNIFPYVSMFLENHVEGVTFQPHEPGDTVEVRVDARERRCRTRATSSWLSAPTVRRSAIPTFLYVPRVANVLRERERHIAKLEGELATKDNGWTKRSWISPNSTASTRSCSSCSASRRKNWNAATVGRRS